MEKEYKFINNINTLTNEEINEMLEELTKEKERRNKIDKRESALLLREALYNFLNSGAYADFSVVCALTPCDVDVFFDNDCDWRESDIDYVEFNPFEREVLLTILNELTRCIGNYEG